LTAHCAALRFVPSPASSFAHLLVEFSGAKDSQLRDATLLSGLLIAAASGAGLTALGTPFVRQLPNGELGGVLLLERFHIAAHTLPSSGTLLLDVLAPHSPDARKVVDVFARRLGSATKRIEHATSG
jgi:S-adenosylmethionine/arginine decarboxylase-like enzyme